MRETRITLCVILLSYILYPLPTSDWIRFYNLVFRIKPIVFKKKEKVNTIQPLSCNFLTFNFFLPKKHASKISEMHIWVSHFYGCSPSQWKVTIVFRIWKCIFGCIFYTHILTLPKWDTHILSKKNVRKCIFRIRKYLSFKC